MDTGNPELNELVSVASGLMVAEKPSSVESSKVFKEGVLEKAPRKRALLAAYLPSKWTTRTFKLHANKRIQYWEGDSLKGEFFFLV